MSCILIVDDEESLRDMLQVALERDTYTVFTAANGHEALACIQEHPEIQIVLTDMRMDGMTGIELIAACQERHPQLVCIIMTAFAEWDSAVSAMRLGAFNFIRKPFDNDVVRSMIKRACHAWDQRQEDRDSGTAGTGKGQIHIIGSSSAIQKLQQMIEHVSPTDATILITGESGTGKELCAHAVHYHSLRSDGAFVRINSGALAETLLESELFGHKKGAFTGAVDDKPGMFELANNGTLFLDEVGELSLNTQVKLLRVLESGEYIPVGGREIQHCDVRVVAATNRNLQEMVKAGSFREDLYYRLAIITIELTPLRERVEDIPLLAGHLLKRHAIRLRRGVGNFTKDAVAALTRYNWPGNIRELDNRIQRGVALTTEGDIDIDTLFGDLDSTVTGMWRSLSNTKNIRKNAPPGQRSSSDDGEDSHAALERIPRSEIEGLSQQLLNGKEIDLEAACMQAERTLVKAALEAADYNMTDAAKKLGISFRQMRYKVKNHGLK